MGALLFLWRKVGMGSSTRGLAAILQAAMCTFPHRAGVSQECSLQTLVCEDSRGLHAQSLEGTLVPSTTEGSNR